MSGAAGAESIGDIPFLETLSVRYLTRPEVAVVVTAEATLNAFMRHHLAAISRDFALTVSVNSEVEAVRQVLPADVRFVRNGLQRKVAVFRDVRELVRLTRWMRGARFTVVHTITPKAGLLGMVAARLAGVPVRIHTFTGQVWAVHRGWKRWVLKSMDRVLAGACTHPLADSHSQLEFLHSQGVLKASVGAVPADGSIAGVDITRFRPDPVTRSAVRDALGIGATDVVLVFVGRLNRDKGIVDLAAAFRQVAQDRPDLHLVVVGPDEGDFAHRTRVAAGDVVERVHVVGPMPKPEEFLVAGDVFCLPSYREGFGVSVIEAAACGLPSVVSEIYGLTDAVVGGETGLFHRPGDIDGIAERLAQLADDSVLRASIGAAALRRVRESFTAEQVTAALVAEYHGAIARHPARYATHRSSSERD